MQKNIVFKGLGLALGTVVLSNLGYYASTLAENHNGVIPASMCSTCTLSAQDIELARAASERGQGVVSRDNALLIDMVDGTSLDTIQAKCEQWREQYGIEARFNSTQAGENALLVASVAPGVDVAKVLQRLNEDELVTSAEYNWIVTLSAEEMEETPAPKPADKVKKYPNDPLYKHQWHLDMINAPDAWRFSQGRGAVVAVIDTGVAWKDSEGFVACEDLAQTKIVPGFNFVSALEPYALDDNGHGTHVAGTIAQSTNNGIGVCGVAPKAAIMPIKVLSGYGGGSISNIVDGIRYAADHGANVINMSLGGPLPSLAMEDAVAYANSKGVLVVCAAGNEHRQSVGFPAGCRDSFVVSALDAKGKLAWYSNYGKRVDIAAPGGDTRNDDNGDGVPDGVYQNTIKMHTPTEQGYFAFQGTSMATPHVAGAAAVLVGQGVNSPKALKRLLSSSANKNVGADKGGAISKVASFVGLGERAVEGYGAGGLDIGKAALKAGAWFGALRLLLALCLACCLKSFCSARCKRAKLEVASGLVVASSGLFFLPWLGHATSWFSFLTLPLPAWDVFFWSAGLHGNLIVCSCALPALLVFSCAYRKGLRHFAAGVSLGWAAYMLVEMFTGATHLHLIPGWLAWLWWLVNAVACGCLAAGAQVNVDKR